MVEIDYIDHFVLNSQIKFSYYWILARYPEHDDG